MRLLASSMGFASCTLHLVYGQLRFVYPLSHAPGSLHNMNRKCFVSFFSGQLKRHKMYRTSCILANGASVKEKEDAWISYAMFAIFVHTLNDHSFFLFMRQWEYTSA